MLRTLSLFLVVILSCSCSMAPKQAKKPAIEPYNNSQLKSGELEYRAPKHWRQEPVSSPMRIDQYLISKGDKQAEVSVYFFPGTVQGVQANLDRWEKQFKDDGYRKVHNIKQFNQGGLPITIAMYEGTYLKALMPMMPNSPKKEIADQAMLGSIVETQEGLWFFKMLGNGDLVMEENLAIQAFTDTFKI